MELNAEQIKNEIQSLIKALKDCGGWVKRGNGEGWFNHEILADALALITSQEERIEGLASTISRQRITMEWLNDKYRERTEEKENLHASCTELTRKCASLTEENERLRADNEIKNQKRANIFEIVNAFERGRADGVQKMLERIKEDAISVSLLSNPPKFMLEIREDALDQIAKEVLEGNNDI